jgi:hypothetical protein
MRDACVKNMIALATKGTTPLHDIVRKSIEAGIVVPSILKRNLETAGYQITYHIGPGDAAPQGKHKFGSWIIIKYKNQNVIARAYSHDNADALLQAIYQAIK